jgi:Ulp1 family protease
MGGVKIRFVDSLITTGNRQYTNLSKRNYDVFDDDIIIMPIHFGHHWSLAVVENPGFLIDDKIGSRTNHTKIYHYDSLTPKGNGHSKRLVSDVLNEFLEKALSSAGNAAQTCPSYAGNVAQRFPIIEDGDSIGIQGDNTLDCGLFVCKFMEHVFMKTTTSNSRGFKSITQKDCTEFRKELVILLARLSCHHSQVREKCV